MNDVDFYRQLGAAQQAIEHLTDAQQQTNAELFTMRRELAEISRTLSEAKGGWQVLISIGTIGAALGGILASFAQTIWSK